MAVICIVSAYLADLVFGDPEWLPHPVRGVGSLINMLDKKLRGNTTVFAERLKGAIAALLVVATSGLLAYFLIRIAVNINPILGSLVWVFLAYTSLSVRDLSVKIGSITDALKKNDIPEARRRLSKIVGRDTSALTSEKITTAAVESIAESTNDGIVAPLFYLVLGGPVLAIIYKSVNTLDSMLGYKNEKYLHFGWFSAKMDDVLNFIPARITGLLIALSSFITGKGFESSFRTMLRDGRKHPSPNSGVSEAAMAGALGIRLGGESTYGGKVSIKPYIGESKKTVKPQLIREALAIGFVSSLIMVLAGAFIRWVI